MRTIATVIAVCAVSLVRWRHWSEVAAAEALLPLPFGDPEGRFHVCVTLARFNERERALVALRRSVDAGFSCPAGLHDEPSLRTLHGNPEFEERVGSIREPAHSLPYLRLV